LKGLTGVLQSLPSSTIPSAHVSIGRPTSGGALPAIAVSATAVQDLPAGVGRLVGTTRLSDTVWSSTTGSRIAGEVSVELWAADQAAMTTLADAVFELLDDPSVLEDAGFLRFAVASAGPVEEAVLGATGTDTALRMPIGCSFLFEAVVPAETGPDGLIKHVHVELTGVPDEAMDLP
jgi:hypothetical protein